MRRLIVPTCLLLCAWTSPTNPAGDFFTDNHAGNVSVVPKTAAKDTTAVADAKQQTDDLASDPAPLAHPAETTADLSDPSAAPSASPDADEAEVAAAPAVPMPPRRTVPHKLVCEELAVAAANNNVPAAFLIKLINQESHFNQNAVSPVGAQGVAQFMPQTAAQMRLSDPFDPLKAVHASAELLRNLLEQFGNKLGLAAAAYNAGPKRVQDWLVKGGKLPQETRDYVQRITGRNPEEWKSKMVSAQLRVSPNTPCQHEAGLYASNGPAVIPLPPQHGGSGSAIQVATLRSGHKHTRIEVASADPDASIVISKGPGHRQTARIQIGTPKTHMAAAKVKVTPAKVQLAAAKTPATLKGKVATVTIAAKSNSKSGKARTLQYAEARAHK